MTIVKYRNSYDFSEFRNENVASKLLNVKNTIHDEFIYGGHLLSLCPPTVALSLMLVFHLSLQFEFLVMMYFFTLCVYNFDHYRDLDVDASGNSARTQYLSNHKNSVLFLTICYACIFIFLLIIFGSIESIIFGAFFLVLALLYSIKLKAVTKKIAGFKNCYTAFCISLMVVFISVYYSHPINLFVFLVIVYIFIHFILNTSFCDIKDMESDAKKSLKTLPLLFGKEKFLLFLHSINLISLIILFGASLSGLAPKFVIILALFVFFYHFYYIQKSYNPQANFQFLSNIVADSEFLFWPVLLFIGSMFVI